MKKTWSPQYRCKLLFNPLIWGVCICIAACISLCLFFVVKNTSALFCLALAVGYVFWAYMECKRWDVGGYRTISINSISKIVTFDNKINIPFQAIEKVQLNLEEPPKPIWITRRKFYQEINDFNGFLEFCLKTGEKITIAVQFRHEAQDIIENLRDCGVVVQMSESDKYDVTGMYQLAWNLIWIVPAVIWFLWKLFVNR